MSLSFKELTETLQAHYEPKTSIIAERFHFHKRSQHTGESITDFVAELRPWIIHTNVDWNCFRNLCVTEFQSLLSAYTEIVHVINHGGTRGKCRRFRSSF